MNLIGPSCCSSVSLSLPRINTEVSIVDDLSDSKWRRKTFWVIYKSNPNGTSNSSLCVVRCYHHHRSLTSEITHKCNTVIQRDFNKLTREYCILMCQIVNSVCIIPPSAEWCSEVLVLNGIWGRVNPTTNTTRWTLTWPLEVMATAMTGDRTC